MGKRQIRRHYLVNSKVQIGIALRFFICLLVVAALSGWAVYYAVWQAVLTEFHGVNISKMYHAVSMRLVFYGLGTACILSVLSIFVSHKIAGPIYKIRLMLDHSVESGKKPEEIRLRRGDAFKDFAESLNRFVKTMC